MALKNVAFITPSLFSDDADDPYRRRRGLSFSLFLCTRNFYFTTGEGKVSSVGSVVVGSAFSRLVNVGYDGVCHILMSAFVCLHPPKNITRKMRTGNFPRKAPRTTTPREKLAEIAFCSSFPPLILQPVSELISFPLCLSPSSHGHARILLPRTNTRDGDTNVCIKCVYAEKGGEAGIGIIYSSSKKIVPSAVTGDDFYFLAFGKTKLLSLSHVSLFLGFFFSS